MASSEREFKRLEAGAILHVMQNEKCMSSKLKFLFILLTTHSRSLSLYVSALSIYLLLHIMQRMGAQHRRRREKERKNVNMLRNKKHLVAFFPIRVWVSVVVRSFVLVISLSWQVSLQISPNDVNSHSYIHICMQIMAYLRSSHFLSLSMLYHCVISFLFWFRPKSQMMSWCVCARMREQMNAKSGKRQHSKRMRSWASSEIE